MIYILNLKLLPAKVRSAHLADKTCFYVSHIR